MESPPFSYICSDLLFEILSGGTLKVVDKFKTVSKDCKEICYESMFIEQHRKKTNNVYGFFIQTMLHCKYVAAFISPHHDYSDGKKKKNSLAALDFMLPESEILASSDQGLLCCVGHKNGYKRRDRFYVCKPTTKQLQLLPNPKLRYMTEKVSLVVLHSNPLHYKIIRLSQGRHVFSTKCQNLQCEIFDSKTWEWKQSEEILLPTRVLIKSEPGVITCGRIHWLLTNNQVLAFDSEKETHTTFSLPNLPDSDGEDEFWSKEYKKLIKYKDGLGFIWEKSGSLELWCMEDRKNNMWRKIEELGVNAMKEKEPYCFPHPVALYTTDTALMSGHDLFFYNFHNSGINMVKLPHHTHLSAVFSFRSDFELVNLRGGN